MLIKNIQCMYYYTLYDLFLSPQSFSVRDIAYQADNHTDGLDY